MENIDEIETLLDDTEQDQKNKMIEGSFWLTMGNFLSRFLGALYIIPWYAWMGTSANEANALFGMGYNVYALFLLISTSGIPVAVAKEVAKYNTLGDKNVSYKLVRQMSGFMLILGAVASIAMYLLSPALAHMSGGGDSLIPVMRSLSYAVFIFPAMSVIRGFFQGNNNLKPFAVSQLAEQLIRVIWMLLTAFIIMKLGSGDYVKAVIQSTTAAFIGMLASIAVLFYYLVKTGDLTRIINPGPTKVSINSKELLVNTVIQAVPFIILGSAIQIFKVIDQFTFSNVMTHIGNFTSSDLLTFFSYFSGNPDKLTMILVAVAVSISGVGIPLITANFVKGNTKATANLISDNLLLYFAFMVPAVTGLSILALPAYTVFYNRPNNLALNLFVFAVIQSFVLGLYMMITPMMQSLRRSRLAVRYFFYIVLLKILLQIPAIYLFESYGPMISTTLAFSVACYFYMKKLHRITDFDINLLLRRLAGILTFTIIMALVTALVFTLLRFVLGPGGKVRSLLVIVLAGGSGFLTYLFLILKSHYIDLLLGERGVRLRKKLKM
ncbi:polysaccharide biosynthesis protein [Streptococcaceae bacterium ESL0687]|nr:polysaccharide biosynthesis protein [Streptococcaceae bacterium ESL0687]